MIDTDVIRNAVMAHHQLVEKRTKSKENQSLFLDEERPILLQITCIRIPQTPCMRLRFPLPHPLVTDTSDVCLIVKDSSKTEKDPEVTVQLYRERLAELGIKGINQIIPWQQIRTEYSQYEQQRHFLKMFDVFLCDVRITKKLVDFFGKHFRNNLKIPMPISMRKDLKKEIEKGLSKTTLNLHSRGSVYVVQVSHTKQSVDEAVENIKTVVEGLAKSFPGGIANIRSIYVKGHTILPVPIYVTFKSRNEVQVPVVKPRRPKRSKPVEDELSTVLGARVVVYPGGKIVLKKDPDYEGELDWNRSKKKKKIYKPEEEEQSKPEEVELNGDSDSEEKPEIKLESEEEADYGDEMEEIEEKDDDLEPDVKSEPEDSDVEEVENLYLQQWKRKWEEDNEENVAETKQKTPKKQKTKEQIKENKKSPKKISIGLGKSKKTQIGVEMSKKSRKLEKSLSEKRKKKESKKKKASLTL